LKKYAKECLPCLDRRSESENKVRQCVIYSKSRLSNGNTGLSTIVSGSSLSVRRNRTTFVFVHRVGALLRRPRVSYSTIRAERLLGVRILHPAAFSRINSHKTRPIVLSIVQVFLTKLCTQPVQNYIRIVTRDNTGQVVHEDGRLIS
jgi:hypothetical protein